ncbi:MAG: tol-pal system-associated acyl-CoA thioesterase [Pseudomonadota bacterium]|nr:tol-pal system-associated acyl-CoA thioesterase [Pseudomonadota bacterium]
MCKNTHLFRLSVRVYYEDTDFSGVVYHARYLHFFERGRTESLRECGVTHTELLARPEPLVFAVRKMTTEWLVPARVDDLLDVRTSFAEVRGARMLLDQEIRRGDALLARAAVEAVCMSPAGKPRRLPADILEAFRPR